MSTNNAVTQTTTKSGHTRKINNAFRRYCVEFEKNELHTKMDGLSEATLDEIVGKLEEIGQHHRDRMEEVENEILDECSDKLREVVDEFGWDVVNSLAKNNREPFASYVGVYHGDKDVDHMQPSNEAMEDPRFMDIPSLKWKYAALWETFEEEMNTPLWKRYGLREPGTMTQEPEETPKATAVLVEMVPTETELGNCTLCGHKLIAPGKCQFINHKQR
jgi:hypothetical protein